MAKYTYTIRFLKYMWPFFNIMHDKVNKHAINQKQPPEVFYKKGIFKNFTKFTRKHLCQSLFFNKAADFRTATFLKKRLSDRCFPVNFATFSRLLFLIEHL